MHLNLSQIVDAALQSETARSKVASAPSTPVDRGFETFDHLLAQQLGQLPVVEEAKTASNAEKPKTKVAEDIVEGLEVATALELCASTIEKIAAEAPEVFSEPFHTATTQTPKAQASSAARKASGPGPTSTGPTGTLPTSAGTHEHEAGAVNHPGKTAALRLLKSKLAEHDMLVSAGQIDAATETLREAQALKDKIAGTENGGLETSPGEATGSRVPDNAGLINLTKAQARDASQRAISEFVSEPVKRDNAVAASQLKSDGLKLSSKMSVKVALSMAPVAGAAKGLLGKADGALQAVGGKVLGGARAAGRSVAGAVDGARTAPYGAGAARTMAAKGATKLHQAASTVATQTPGTAVAKRIAGGAALGAGVVGTGAALHAAGGK